jgi:hypothetical protein
MKLPKNKKKRSLRLKNPQLMVKETMQIKLVLYQKLSLKNLRRKEKLLTNKLLTSNSNKKKEKSTKIPSSRTETT